MNQKNDMTAPMPLIVHLKELRHRLVVSVLVFLVCTVCVYPFVQELYDFFSRPLWLAMKGEEERRLIFTSLPDVFLVYLKLSLYGGLLLSFPVWAWQLWLFIAPGLYQKEKSFTSGLLVATPILFFAGAAFSYFVVMPLAWDFFLSFEQETSRGLPIQLEAKVDEYLSFSMRMIFAFGLAFELPVLLLLLSKAGVVTREQLIKGRKYVVIAVFALAAIITPPDVITQIVLAVPMLLLFEISLWLMIRR